MRLGSFSFLSCVLLAVATFALPEASAAKTHSLEPYRSPLAASNLRRLPAHPRLFGGPKAFAAIRRNAKDGSYGQVLAGFLLRRAEEYLKVPPMPRKVVGGRMLETSRQELRLFTTLATAWVITGDKRFADRAIAELINVSKYEDWHPQHFLDTGEMALGAALAYDWLWSEMSPDQRKLVSGALKKSGMDASLIKVGGHQWLQGKNNWVQVCHAGMIAAALATAEDYPENNARIINRAIAKLPDAMNAAYPPNGAYPEGVMYWSYGTSFNCIAIALLEESFGKDFRLAATPGFSKTLQFFIAGYGNSQVPFSYADCYRRKGPDLKFESIWLARRFGCGDQITKGMRERWMEFYAKDTWRYERIIALGLIYMDAIPEKYTPPKDTWYYSGRNELVNVAMLRTGFDPKDIYLGVKGGKVRTPHGHMDVGSFVLDLDGHRFVADLGMVTYEDFEGKVQLWGMHQGSDRWSIFRLGPASHNIIRIDGGEQPVDEPGWITSVTKDTVQIDLTPVYRNKAKRVRREWKLFPDQVEMSDLFAGLKPGARVVAQFCIQGDCMISGDEVNLKYGKSAAASVKAIPDEGIQGSWSVRSAKSLHNKLDPDDKGVNMLCYTFMAPESGAVRVMFRFSAGTPGTDEK